MSRANTHHTHPRTTAALGHHRTGRELNPSEHLVIQIVMGNDISLVMPVIKNLQNKLLAHHPVEEREVLRIGMALHEALLNAIYHGNLELDSELRQEDESHFHDLAEIRRHQAPYCDRQVVVQLVLTERSATFLICDDGPGFDVSAVADPTEGDNVFRVGGRGLLMIRSFMDKVSHNHRGNEITMVKKLPRPVDSPLGDDLRIQGRSNAETVAGMKILL